MIALLETALIAGAIVYAVRMASDIGARALSVIEAREARAAATPDKVRIPADLMMRADSESEPWAKEQLRASLREAYEELGDWELVRARMA